MRLADCTGKQPRRSSLCPRKCISPYTMKSTGADHAFHSSMSEGSPNNIIATYALNM